MSETLLARLTRLGRRLLLVMLAAGFFLGLAAAVLFLGLCVWLDLLWELTPAERIASSAGAVLCLAMLVAGTGWWAWRRRVPQALARRLDGVAGTSGQVLSGVELALTRSETVTLTAGLADLAIDHAGRLVNRVANSQAVPLRPAYLSSGGLGMLAALTALAALIMPRLAQTQWLRFTDPYGDHPPYSRVLFEVQPGDVQVVYGSSLEITVHTSGAAVDRLEIVLLGTDGAQDVLPLFPVTGNEWRATIAEVTAGGQYFVRATAGRSRKFQLRVITVPRIEQVHFRITLPAYTHRPAYEGPLPQGGLAGLPGTRVQIRATSNRPLSRGSIQLPGPQRLVLDPVPSHPQEVSGQFELHQEGKLQLQVTDVDGQDSTEIFSTPISLLKDQRPFIRLLQPPALALATPDAALPVILAAEDDYGIARVQLFRSLNNSPGLPLDLVVGQPPPTQWTGSVLLPLARYGLQPGDEIKLFGRVEDNDPAGAKGSESAIAVVRIIAQEDYERLVRRQRGLQVLQSKYQQAQRRLETLADEVDRLQSKLKKLPPNSPAAAQLRQALRTLRRRFQEETEALRRLSRSSLPYDLDRELAKHLERLSEQVDQLARDTETLASRSGLSNAEAARGLARLLEKLRGDQKDWQDQVLAPLGELSTFYPLIEDAARFIALYLRQRNLAERLQSLKNLDRTDNPAVKSRMRDLQNQQLEIRTALEKLLDDIDDHAAKLPEDPDLEELRSSAQDFVAKVRASGAFEAMTEAETGLAEFSGKRGHEGARRAADILEKFIAFLEGGQGLMMKSRQGLELRCRRRFQPTLVRGLGDSIDQLLNDAGLLPGSGSLPGLGDSGNQPGQGTGAGGTGAGSGFSARRGTLDNIGLFGNLPGAGEAGGLGQSPQGEPGQRAGDTQLRDADSQPLERGGQQKASASGSNQGAVPPLYRKRVSEYFQRIADEAAGK